MPIALGALLIALVLLWTAPAAHASANQSAMFEDSNELFSNPASALQSMRSLGVGVIRLDVPWRAIAPDPQSRTRPANFNASNPAAYPQANWAPYDAIVSDAWFYGIRVELLVSGGAPLWAAWPGAPSGSESIWAPSAVAYGQFVQAVAARYRTVHFWELWNEPNWGPSLAPQVSSGAAAPVAAREYRSLLNQGWGALQRSGHGRDTIIAGGLSPDGSARLTPTATSSPIAFVRSLYCVDRSYRPLTGRAAQALGCPRSAAASRRMPASYPALFKVTGFGVHPYGYGNPPDTAAFPNPDSVELSEIPQFTSALDRLQRTYGSSRWMWIYNTEYGYQTRPPQQSRQFPSPVDAARYMNWAEYLSWRNARILSFDQYELADSGWFTTGLLFSNRQPKPAYYAYLLPLFLPVNVNRSGHRLEVWGNARPAANAKWDTHQPQTVWVQFQRWPWSSFRTVSGVRISNPSGYFDTHVSFPASGAVRLAWAYPSGDQRLFNPLSPGSRWIYSRTSYVNVR